MTRYKLFDKIELLCEIVKNSENNYSKMVFSGDLAITHHDYGKGLYDVNIYYIELNKKHYCRIWFGTIDDGDYGSWTKCPTKKLACNLVKKAAKVLKDINICPSHEKLNKLFNPLNIYLNHE